MPRNVPTKAQISKLPVWAQEYINRIEGERETAVDALFKFRDEQTESNVFVQDHVCVGEGTNDRESDPEKKGGPTFLRHYIQTKRVQFSLPRDETEMEVYVNEEEHRIEIRLPRGYPLLEAASGNHFYIHPKEDMFLNPSAVTLCQAACDAPKLSHDAFTRKYGFSQEALEGKMRSVVPKSAWGRTVHG